MKTNVHLVCGVLLAVPLIYWPYLKDYTLGPKLMVWSGLLLVASGIAFANKAPWPQNRLLLPAAAFGLLSSLSTFLATDPVLAIPELLKLLAGLGTLVIVGGFRPMDVERCAQCVVIAAAISAGIGCLQYFDVAPWPIPSAGLPSGTLGFRNIAAMVTIQAIPFAIWLVHRRGGVIWPSVLTVLTAFLIQTRTRGAWLGIVAAGMVWIYLNRRDVTDRLLGRWRLWVVVVVAAIVMGSPSSRIDKIGPQDIDEKKTTVANALGSILTEGGDRGRTVLWQQTLPMIVANPLGVGLGNWKIHYPLYDEGISVTDYGAPSRPHNDPLWIASETGVLGLLAFLWLLFAASKARTAARSNRGLIEAALASIVAITIHSCFSFPRDRATPTLLFWFALAAIAALSRSGQKKLNSVPVWSVQAVTLAATILICARLISFESHLFTATRAESESDWGLVASETNEALDKGRFHSDALHLGGYALNTLQRTDEALAFYEERAKYRPYDVQYLNGHAIALQNAGNIESSIHTYRKARSLVATSLDLDYNLATLLIQNRQPVEAEALLTLHTNRAQPDPALLFHLGNARALQGKDQMAIGDLELAVKHEPRLSQAWMILGELYYRQRMPKQALNAFSRFVDQHERDDRYRQRATTAIRELKSQLEASAP